jgi:hypothetical protein
MTEIRASITLAPSTTLPNHIGWRGLHFIGREGARTHAQSGVIPPFDPTIALEMTRDIQLMSYELMAHFSPAVKADKEKWHTIHGYKVCMNNFAANGFDGGTAHPDYVNNRDLNATNPLKYDKMQRTFSGSFITGRLEGNVIWCEPGKDAIDARNFVYEPGTPEASITLKSILDNHWYSYGVVETKQLFSAQDNWGMGILFSFILDRP